MFCVFVKELKQFRHCQTAIILFILTLLLSLSGIAVSIKDNSVIKFSNVLLGFAYVFAGIYQLAIIITAASRWKNENGNGSTDIIYTTPISPLSTACAKTAATVLCAFTGMILPVTASEFTTQEFEWLKYMIFTLLQVAALSSVSLGAASFQRHKGNSFDWTIVLTIVALLPLLSLISTRYPLESIEKFYAVSAGFISASAFGIASAVCGASPKTSDRAMALKITCVCIATGLPIVYKYTLLKDVSWKNLLGFSFGIAAICIMFAALFERMQQTRRVLANSISKLLFPFNTGVANSFVLFSILGIIASLLIYDTEFTSIIAKIFLLTGICQLFRNRNNSEFPIIPAVIIGFTTMLLTIALPFLPDKTAEHIRPILFYTKSPAVANIICVLLGSVIYTTVSMAEFKQYFMKEKTND